MSLFTITPENAPRRTDIGATMWSCPTYDGLSVTVKNPSGCSGCINRIDHNVAETTYIQVPAGESRYQRLQTNQKQTVQLFNELQAGLFLWKYILFGYIGDNVQYNATAANNATLSEVVKIVSTSADVVTVRGRNPKLLIFGRFRSNPEYPAPDPVTGQLGAIVVDELPLCLIPGAAFEVGGMSCLWGKTSPLIGEIGVPESEALNDVQYTVKFNGYANMTNLMQPWNASWTPPEYAATIRFEGPFADNWLDMQAPPERQVTKLTKLVPNPEIVELKDSNDESCRIIPPEFPNAVKVTFTGPTFSLTNDEIRSRLNFIQSPTGWQTFIDLTGLTFDSASVTYWPQAVLSDTLRVQYQSACSHSKVDPTGSYKHGTARYCERPNSSGFENFKDECWLWANCDNWELSDPKDAKNTTILSLFQHQAEWILAQQVEGDSSPRNYQLLKRGGPSVQAFMGSFCDEVYRGKFPKMVEFFGNPMGRRFEYVNYDGQVNQALIQGAYYQKPYDLGPDAKYEFDTANPDSIMPGVVALGVENFTFGKPDNDYFPFRNTGNCNVYSFESSASDLSTVNTLMANGEVYMVAIDRTVEDLDTEVSRIRNVYAFG